MKIFRLKPKPRINAHLTTGETVQGFLIGRYAGHYHIAIPTILTAADTSHKMDSAEVAIPAEKVKLLELL